MKHFIAQMLFTIVLMPTVAFVSFVEWLMGVYEDNTTDEYEKRYRLAVWILILIPPAAWGMFDLLRMVF